MHRLLLLKADGHPRGRSFNALSEIINGLAAAAEYGSIRTGPCVGLGRDGPAP
jgi:hypothetical protein